MPSPAPSAAPSMSPGMSATTKLRFAVRAHDAEVRRQRRERIVGHLGTCRRHCADERRLAGIRHAEEADVRQHPSSSRSRRCSPFSPGVNCRGARFVLDLKCRLPRPPVPPLATRARCPSAARSATNSAVSASVITVPTGTRRTTSSAPWPNWSEPRPFSPPFARWMRVAVVDQGIDVAVGNGPDAAAAAAVAAVGTAAGHELLPAEARSAVAAIAGDHLDHRLVEEFHLDFLT